MQLAVVQQHEPLHHTFTLLGPLKSILLGFFSRENTDETRRLNNDDEQTCNKSAEEVGQMAVKEEERASEQCRREETTLLCSAVVGPGKLAWEDAAFDFLEDRLPL